MARQVSWESRLHEIRRSVANSVRSHYDRRDLELLFKLQPRAAGKLLESLPTVRIGRSYLVLREALANFLDGANDAEDVGAYCAAQRTEREAKSRRKPRSLVRRDFDLVPAASLSRWLSPGELKIQYSSLEELFDIMWRVASALRDDLEGFAQLYEVEPPVKVESDARREVEAMFAELSRLEENKAFELGQSRLQMDTKKRRPRIPAPDAGFRAQAILPHSPPETKT